MPGYANPPKEHQFKPGTSGNPAGPGKQVIAKKILKQYTQDTIANVFNKLLGLSQPELIRLIKDSNTPVIEVIMAQGLLKDFKKVRMDCVEKMLDRIIGRVQQTVLSNKRIKF